MTFKLTFKAEDKMISVTVSPKCTSHLKVGRNWLSQHPICSLHLVLFNLLPFIQGSEITSKVLIYALEPQWSPWEKKNHKFCLECRQMWPCNEQPCLYSPKNQSFCSAFPWLRLIPTQEFCTGHEWGYGSHKDSQPIPHHFLCFPPQLTLHIGRPSQFMHRFLCLCES